MLLSILLPEGYDEADAALSVHTFRAAESLGADLDVEVVAADPIARGAHGMRLLPDRLGWDLSRSDVVIVPAVSIERLPATLDDAALLRALARVDTGRRRLLAFGNGVQLLARAGHLKDRAVAATGHDAPSLVAAGARIADDVVAADGHVHTAAGGARARREALLALAGAILGPAFADRVAAEGAARA